MLGVTLGSVALSCPLPAQDLKSKDEGKAKAVSGDIGLSYERSTANSQTSDFHEALGVNYGLGWQAFDTAQLSFESSFDREMGVPVEEFRPGNSKIGITSHPYPGPGGTQYTLGAAGVLPTREDDRTYLGFNGALQTKAGLSKGFEESNFSMLRNLKLGTGAVANRSFFAYDSSKAGTPNTLWTFTLGLNAAYIIFPDLSLAGAFSNTRAWKSNGGVGNDFYEFSFGLNYAIDEHLTVSLNEVTSDRTFSYDRVTPNMALYDSRRSAVVGSIGYSL